MSLAGLARGVWEEWRRNTTKFAWDLFGFEPDRWQKKAFDAWDNPSNDRIAMQACAGPGKSVVEVMCAYQFLVCRSDGVNHPNAYAMSVTGENLRDNFWKETAVWYDRSPVLQRLFEWQKEQIVAREAPAIWWLRARSYSRSADPEAQGRTLSGLHARAIAYFVDEAGDIPPSVLRSAEQGLSNCEFGKIMMAGNPTSHDGALYLAANDQSHLWKVIPVTGDPDDLDRSPRIDIEWAREQIRTYGRDNPWVMAYVLGKFPPSSIDTLLSPDEVRAAIGRGIKEEDFSHVQKRIGVDVARFGDDRTVLFPRQGLLAFQPIVMRNARTHDIAARLIEKKQSWGSEVEFIDDTGGYGAGVIDSCLLAGVTLVPVHFSGASTNPRYYNKRSQLHFDGANWVKRGGALPEGLTEIIREATAPKYWFEKGKFRVEEKDQIKKRLGFSPDYWDALITSFALPDMPAGFATVVGAGSKPVLSEYDPLEDQHTKSYGVGRALILD